VYLTAKIIINPNKNQCEILTKMTQLFSNEVCKVLEQYIEYKSIVHIDYKHVNFVPWDSKVEVLREAQKYYRRFIKNQESGSDNIVNLCIWNDKNCKISYDKINIQIDRDNYMSLDYYADNYQMNLIEECRFNMIKIRKSKGKWFGYINLIKNEQNKSLQITMAVDLGIKVPAVAITSGGKIKFFGKGREINFLHRANKSKLKRLVKHKKFNLILRMKGKWSRRIIQIDHSISKKIIDFAITEEVGIIKLENLSGIQKNRKYNSSVSRWSYYRLQRFIAYKARKNNIKVIFVDPSFTSQKCPVCNLITKSRSRIFECICGFKKHRDIVGAMNILKL